MTQSNQESALFVFAIVCLIIAGIGAWQDRERIINAYCDVERICFGE